MSRTVLLVCSEFPPHTGGIGNHAWNLARYLSQNGITVKVLAPAGNTSAAAEFDQSQPFRVTRLATGRIRKFAAITAWLRKMAVGETLIVASGQSVLLAVAASFVFIGKKTIKVAMAHGLDINSSDPILHALVNRALSRYHRIIAVSSFTASCLKPILRKKAVVINNGFDASGFQVNGSMRRMDQENLRLITVGSVSQRKGQLNVIRALPLIKQKYSRVHYFMVGVPAIESEVNAEAEKLGVRENISVLGALAHEQMKTALSEADIFVMLSEPTPNGDFEGFGIAIVEANAIGLPAIGSKGCGIEDAVRSGYSGQLVDAHNPREILEAINTIVNDYDSYKKQSQVHASGFGWDSVIGKYVSEFKELEQLT